MVRRQLWEAVFGAIALKGEISYESDTYSF
jgi:hypothetical protein